MTTPPADNENANLDVLRAVAVLLVLLDHVLETIGWRTGVSFHPVDWQFGRLGVLMFFVHTSLVLMQSLRRLAATERRGLFATFVVRRAFRIYPLAVLCILVAVGFGVPALPWLELRPLSAGALLSNLALTSNLTDSAHVLMPLWTLAIELQMYLLLPPIFLLLGPAPRWRTAVMLLLASLPLAILQPALGTRFLLLAFAPCFLAGVVAWSLAERVRPRLPGWGWPVALCALVAAYLAGTRLTGVTHPPTVGWGACLALGLAIPCFAPVRGAALRRVAQLVARYSYGIYLSNAVLLWAAFARLADVGPWVRWSAFAIATVVVPVAAYHLVEAPMIRIGARVASRFRERAVAPVAAAAPAA